MHKSTEREGYLTISFKILAHFELDGSNTSKKKVVTGAA